LTAVIAAPPHRLHHLRRLDTGALPPASNRVHFRHAKSVFTAAFLTFLIVAHASVGVATHPALRHGSPSGIAAVYPRPGDDRMRLLALVGPGPRAVPAW